MEVYPEVVEEKELAAVAVKEKVDDALRRGVGET